MKAIASRDNAAFKSLARLASSAAERRKRALSVIEGGPLRDASGRTMCWGINHDGVRWEAPLKRLR